MSVESVYGTLLYVARRCLPPDPALEPQDLVQSAYAKVGARLDPARSEGEQIAFMSRAISQVAIDHGRRLAHYPRGVLSPALRAGGDLEHEAIVALDLAAALATPRRGLAEAVLLGVGYGYEEIAAALGLPLGTVKTRIHWCRRGTDGRLVA